jgi:enterochelin esterase family protein
MPAARHVDFLGEPPAERHGRLATHELDDTRFSKKRRIDVWLPPGYDAVEDRYPVVYVHTGRPAIDPGLLPTALDNLVGTGRLRPLIAVVVHRIDEQSFAEWTDRRDDYAAAVAELVVPFVDRTYRTVAQRASRVSYGARFPGAVALSVALKRPETFGVVATQSAFMLDSDRQAFLAALPDAKAHPLTIHLEWGRFDDRAPQEGWDVGRENALLAEGLRERGLTVKAREVAAGPGWGSWRTRWDLVLGELFR